MVRMQDAVCLACVDYADILYIAQGNAVLHACTHNLEHDVTMLHSLALQRCITCLSGCTPYQSPPSLSLLSTFLQEEDEGEASFNGMATAATITAAILLPMLCYYAASSPVASLPVKATCLPSFLPPCLSSEHAHTPYPLRPPLHSACRVLSSY